MYFQLEQYLLSSVYLLFSFQFRKLQDVRDKLERLKDLFEEQQASDLGFKIVLDNLIPYLSIFYSLSTQLAGIPIPKFLCF